MTKDGRMIFFQSTAKPAKDERIAGGGESTRAIIPRVFRSRISVKTLGTELSCETDVGAARHAVRHVAFAARHDSARHASPAHGGGIVSRFASMPDYSGTLSCSYGLDVCAAYSG